MEPGGSSDFDGLFPWSQDFEGSGAGSNPTDTLLISQEFGDRSCGGGSSQHLPHGNMGLVEGIASGENQRYVFIPKCNGKRDKQNCEAPLTYLHKKHHHIEDLDVFECPMCKGTNSKIQKKVLCKCPKCLRPRKSGETEFGIVYNADKLISHWLTPENCKECFEWLLHNLKKGAAANVCSDDLLSAIRTQLSKVPPNSEPIVRFNEMVRELKPDIANTNSRQTNKVESDASRKGNVAALPTRELGLCYRILSDLGLPTSDKNVQRAIEIMKQMHSTFPDQFLPGSSFFYLSPVGNSGDMSLRISFESSYAKTRVTVRARDVREEDTDFICGLYKDPKLMKYFGNGAVRDTAQMTKRVREWIRRFNDGQPHGAVILFDEKNNKIGCAVAGVGSRAGSSEIAAVYKEESSGKGYGTACGLFLDKWASEVRRVGLGQGFKESEMEVVNRYRVVENFKCFGGEPLSRLECTVCPANRPVLSILTRLQFKALEFPQRLDSEYELFDVEGPNEEMRKNPDLLFQRLTDLFMANPRMQDGKYYKVFECDWYTASWHQTFHCVKYHFEKLLT